MDIKQKYEIGGPDGLQIYESYIEPAGAYWKNPSVLKFIAGGTKLSLELEREPKNQYDSNAIKVIGVVHGYIFTKKYHIGYLPAPIAKKIVLGQFWPNVQAHLRMVESREYTHVKFDLLGPIGRKKEYRSLNV
jgi:hypothetical protein